MDSIRQEPIDDDYPFSSMGIHYDYNYPASAITQPDSFIFDLDGIEHVVFDLGGGEKVELDRRELEILVRGFPKLIRLIELLEVDNLD